MSAAAPDRHKATARTRRYRERLEAGIVIAPVPASRGVIALPAP
jgi:hypothetical protein